MMGCHAWGVDRWAVGGVAAYCACRVGCYVGTAGWVVYAGRFGCYASAAIFGVGCVGESCERDTECYVSEFVYCVGTV